MRFYFQQNSKFFPLVFRATDEVFQQLEDNQVTLSTMKASRYVKAFEVEVRYMKVRVVLTGLLAGKAGMVLLQDTQWLRTESFRFKSPWRSLCCVVGGGGGEES